MMDSSMYIVISTLIGNVIGFVLKNKTAFKNRMIPIVMLVMSLLKNTLVSAGLLPQEMSILNPATGAAEVTMLTAGFNWGFLVFVVNTVLDAALPIGTHSMVKNLAQMKKAGP